MIKTMTTSAVTNWLRKYSPDSIVFQAYELAKIAHQHEIRQDGHPYISHTANVAKMVADLNLDDHSVAAAFLHDTIENTPVTVGEIKDKFGEDIANLVDGLTKLKKIVAPENPTESQIENLRKFFIASSGDLRVILIKLMDRLHNMQTLKSLKPPSQKRIAWETMEIYAPLAYRLGMQKLSSELDDLAFPYLYPIEYRWLLKQTNERYQERAAYAEKIKPEVEKLLRDNDINPIVVDARAKSYSSLYKKLLRYDMDFSKIYDLVALRIIVKDTEECYAALGLIHGQWPPLPGRFKDYIARPKPNGYKSLHTTVFCLENKIAEFQIRTQEMHQENELGIAASWIYHQLNEKKDESLFKWKALTRKKELRWVEQLKDWQKSFDKESSRQTMEQFLESLKTDFFKDRIFVVTPENEIIDLPAGATPIDFAYRIHTQIGNQCIGAKINGKIVSLDRQLNSGDIIEIITQPNKKPSSLWLQFVKTDKAKEKIRDEIKKKEHREDHGWSNFIEFKIINIKRIGFLRDLTSVLAKMKVEIISLKNQDNPHGLFNTTLVRCQTVPDVKIRNVITKIKKLAGTKEVTYRLEK